MKAMFRRRLPSSLGASSIALKVGLIAAWAAVLFLPFLFRPLADQPAAAIPAGADHPRLVIVSPHWEGIRFEFGRAFSAWTLRHLGHPTTLEWLDVGGTSDAIRYVRSEFVRSPAGIDVDLFFGGGVDPYIQFARDGLLAPADIPESILHTIPPSFAGIEVYDPARRWFGACLAGFGVMFNREVCRVLRIPEPADWSDLARSDYFTWVGSGDPRSSGSVHMAYEIILQAYGWEKGWAILVAIGGNTRNFSRSAGSVPKDVAIGEVACGMAIDVYAWRQIAEAGADRLGFRLPDARTVINPDGIAILQGAPRHRLAEHFIAFVLGEEGQKLWILKPGAPGGPAKFELDRLPIRPGFAARFGSDAAVAYDPYLWTGGFTYDAEKGALRWTILNDLIGAAVIDVHAELVAAWKTVKDLPPADPRVQRLLTPPCAEAEFLRLAREHWNNAEDRVRIKTDWTREARNLYRHIAGGPS